MPFFLSNPCGVRSPRELVCQQGEAEKSSASSLLLTPLFFFFFFFFPFWSVTWKLDLSRLSSLLFPRTTTSPSPASVAPIFVICPCACTICSALARMYCTHGGPFLAHVVDPRLPSPSLLDLHRWYPLLLVETPRSNCRSKCSVHKSYFARYLHCWTSWWCSSSAAPVQPLPVLPSLLPAVELKFACCCNKYYFR
jgi:hypothetical protein